MHPESERLATAFIRDFWSANRDIRWLQLEHEHELWLDERTVLVGKIDAIGLTQDGEPFFGDWKTASKKKARFMDSEKRKWRFNPQALTYGVLLKEFARKFTVRWALKTEPATTNFEWYDYSENELLWWRGELSSIADSIRAERSRERNVLDVRATNWPVNTHNCLRYGENYPCPFFAEGCPKLNFEHVPSQMTPRGEGHLAVEAKIKSSYNGTGLVVLDATRVDDWMACHELYRRLWEGAGWHEESEALEIGHDFHGLIAAHLGQIKKEQDEHASISISG